MKKFLLTYYLYSVVLLAAVTLFKGYIGLDAILLFWLGGIIGAVLPELDHLIYVYQINPHELTSQRAKRMISQKQFLQVLAFLEDTRYERKNLIFHKTAFQWLFLIFSIFVLTSTNNLFGRGLVLTFQLHLAIDQILDLTQKGSLSYWFADSAKQMTRGQATLYWSAYLAAIIFMALFL